MPEATPQLIHFNQLTLSSALLNQLDAIGYKQMTPVQSLCLPVTLNQNDAVVRANTGSGKTTAFALTLLSKLDVSLFSPQALVLCPTRELADQVADEIRKLAKAMANVKVLTLCGGEPMRIQTNSLVHGAHILVATPGRMVDHIQQQTLDLSMLTTLVLDEADRMLEMGFQPSLNSVTGHLPGQRQTLLFSATYPANIEALAKQVTTNAVTLSVATEQARPNITEYFYAMSDQPEAQQVMALLCQYQPGNCIVFCNTKKQVKTIEDILSAHNFSVLSLHGELDQQQRDQAIIRFSNNSVRVLVATDVASRGLDIAALDLVINVGMAHDIDSHTHRIGRTARAGANGSAVTLVAPQDDYKLRLLEDTMDAPIRLLPVLANQTIKPLHANMKTLQLSGGKKDKLRPGDIVGALTKRNQLSADDIGKIKVVSTFAFVAVKAKLAAQALDIISNSRIKGKRFRAKLLS